MDSQIRVHVTPRSSRNALEWCDGMLKVWVTAAPTDGQANDAVCKLIAKALSIAPSRVKIAKGATSRDKTMEVEGLSSDEIAQRLG